LIPAVFVVACQRVDPRPSVVLVVWDTLRPDHLGTHGYRHDTSPHLDALARRGLVYERCRSHAPSTRPSMASVMTGYLPHETRVLEGERLPEEIDTLAELLGSAGYETGAVVSNYSLRRVQGFSQGFDVYDDALDSLGTGGGFPERLADATTERAIALARSFGQRPFFLWVHYQDVHGPYRPPPGDARRFRDPTVPPRPLRLNRSLSGKDGIPTYQRMPGATDYHDYVARYDGEIHYLDAQFARLVDALRNLGVWERALVILTSDHGESLGERSFYFSHVGQLHEPLTRVAMMLWGPGVEPGRSAGPCQHLDVVPTVLATVGLRDDPRLRGRDLREPSPAEAEPIPVLAATRSPIDRDGRKYSVVLGDWALLHNAEKDVSELIALAEGGRKVDPAEPGHAERFARLRSELARLRSEDRLDLGVGSLPALGEAEQRNLRALGYVE
jgi:arylsulfatase